MVDILYQGSFLQGKEKQLSTKRKDNRGRLLQAGESQRSDGNYQYRYIDIDGKRKTVYSWRLVSTDKIPQGKRNDISLREKENEIKKKLTLGVSGNSSIVLNQMFDSYLVRKRHKGKKLSSKTIQNYTLMWNKRVRSSSLGCKKVSEIRRTDIIAFYYELLENELTYGTVSFFNKIMSAVFNMAIDDGVIFKNPVNRCLREIEGYQREKNPLTVAQQEELLDFAKRTDKSMYRKLVFLLETMCRVSEFAGIRLSNLDMEKRRIIVDHQLMKIQLEGDSKEEYHIRPPKSVAGYRELPMSEKLYGLLKEITEYYFLFKKDYVVDGVSDFLFYSDKGRLINVNNFNYELKNFIQLYNQSAENKIDYISTHILRHTGCTRYAEQGMDIKVLQYLMGHSSMQITNRVYNHVDIERAESVLKQLEMQQIATV